VVVVGSLVLERGWFCGRLLVGWNLEFTVSLGNHCKTSLYGSNQVVAGLTGIHTLSPEEGRLKYGEDCY
jgi:hypothetical protein